MFWAIFLLISGMKLLFIPAYRSTDFEVHRNWLAITHSRPLSKWYFDDTSEWTLDYPPLFAYFEYGLSHIAKWFDRDMLKVENLNYASDATILFQRLSVIVVDLVFAIGVKMCISSLKLQKVEKLVATVLLLANAGLIFVDHIHFQYNGFLFGVLLSSMACMFRQQYIRSAFLFCVLLNLKHIFIYIAPAYGVFLLKNYCIERGPFFSSILKLAGVAVSVFVVSFGPFLDHLPQVLSRLFPFKRGLTHAYWAPNFWALYNFADKAAAIALKTGNKHESSFTSGLVQEYDHVVLASIKPIVTFIATASMMLPCVFKLMLSSNKRNQTVEFTRAVIICALTSFMFGWHVHEKAILMVLIPLSLLAPVDVNEAKTSIFLGAIGYYSLFPLLFPSELLMLKLSYFLAYMLLSYIGLRRIHKSISFNIYEKLYLFSLSFLLIYENFIQYLIRFDMKWPFLPLLLTSVYCGIGVFYIYCQYYVKFLRNTEIAFNDKHKHKTH